jgi:hypothetical protein
MAPPGNVIMGRARLIPRCSSRRRRIKECCYHQRKRIAIWINKKAKIPTKQDQKEDVVLG